MAIHLERKTLEELGVRLLEVKSSKDWAEEARRREGGFLGLRLKVKDETRRQRRGKVSS